MSDQQHDTIETPFQDSPQVDLAQCNRMQTANRAIGVDASPGTARAIERDVERAQRALGETLAGGRQAAAAMIADAKREAAQIIEAAEIQAKRCRIEANKEAGAMIAEARGIVNAEKGAAMPIDQDTGQPAPGVFNSEAGASMKAEDFDPNAPDEDSEPSEDDDKQTPDESDEGSGDPGAEDDANPTQ